MEHRYYKILNKNTYKGNNKYKFIRIKQENFF